MNGINDTYVTDLDKQGMELALKFKVERQFGIWHEQTISGKASSLESLQDLFKKDKERQQDGFPSKIKFRKVLAAPNKVVSVPYVEEEKLVHGEFEPKNIENLQAQSVSFPVVNFPDKPDIEESPGHGDGDIGDVIGETPISRDGEEGDSGQKPGDEPADHQIEEEAYDLGKRLMEQFSLPNLKDKAKKVPTDEYTYDLTDRHRGSGQVLDKKETLKRMVKTNLILGKIDKKNPDTKKMAVWPGDMVYRVLSKERVWKAQAVIIFLRDYSGSMHEPTKALVNQHLMIYSWLLVQYEKRVIPRFFCHDADCKEVTAKEYFGLGSRGGTFIASGYKKINETIEGEGLENDYNIYVFQGTDGDDGDYEGGYALPELKKILRYASRTGVTLFKHPYYKDQKTIFEEYIEKSGVLERKDVFRMHVMSYYDITEEMNIAALKALIAQN